MNRLSVFLIEWFAGTYAIHVIPITARHCRASKTSQDLIQSEFKQALFCLPYHLSSRPQLISSQKPFKNLIVLLISLVSWTPPWHQHTQYMWRRIAYTDVCVSVCAQVRNHTTSTWAHLTCAVYHKWVTKRGLKCNQWGFLRQRKKIKGTAPNT